jgi:hypothetical protein
MYICTPTLGSDDYYMHISGKTSKERPLHGVQPSDKNTNHTNDNNNNNNRQSRGPQEGRTMMQTKSILKEKSIDSPERCLPNVTVLMRQMCVDGPLCVDTIECEMYAQ